MRSELQGLLCHSNILGFVCVSVTCFASLEKAMLIFWVSALSQALHLKSSFIPKHSSQDFTQ